MLGKSVPIHCVKLKYRNGIVSIVLISLYFDQNDKQKTLNNFILYLMQTKVNALRFCNLLKITYPCLSSYRLNISIDGGHFQQFYCSFTFRWYILMEQDNLGNFKHMHWFTFLLCHSYSQETQIPEKNKPIGW